MVQICHMKTHCELNPYLDWANISEPPITLKHFHLELVENINFIFVGIWIFVNSSSIFALSQNAIDHLLIFFNVGCCSSRRSCDVFGWPKEAHRWKYHGSCFHHEVRIWLFFLTHQHCQTNFFEFRSFIWNLFICSFMALSIRPERR